LEQIPDVVSSQVDVFSAKRRKVGWAFGGNRRSFPFESGYRLLQIHGISEDDCGDNQIEPARLVLTILAQPISNRLTAVKEDDASEGVARLAGDLESKSIRRTPARTGGVPSWLRALYWPADMDVQEGSCDKGQ
jgi:hypothetical protein